jgi:hypothetical protein
MLEMGIFMRSYCSTVSEALSPGLSNQFVLSVTNWMKCTRLSEKNSRGFDTSHDRQSYRDGGHCDRGTWYRFDKEGLS